MVRPRGERITVSDRTLSGTADPTSAAGDGAAIVIAVQTMRALAYGFGAVIVGTALAAQGLSDIEVGVVFTAMIAGMAFASLVVGRWGDRLGRRRVYRALLATMGVSGAVFALTSSLPALLLAAATGTLSTDANESGPITTLEQAMLARGPVEARPRLFGRYNAAAYLAGSVGALLAGGPAALRHFIPSVPADQRWLLTFPVVAIVCVVVAGQLPADRASARDDRSPPRGRLHTSQRSVRRLAGLFSVDAFAGGLVAQSFLVFWFARRFGASTEFMGAVFFAAGLLQAGSSLVAGWLASRLGLLRTMVFTHVPSNVLLAAVPLMPSLGFAVAVLLARSALSQMDVPTRQAYIAGIVDPDEVTAAIAYTNTARYVGRPAGPAAAGLLMQRTALAAPLLAAGALKLAYDIALYATFRRTTLARVTGEGT